MTPTQKRRLLGKLMDELVDRAPAMHYSQYRPMRTRFVTTQEALLAKLDSDSGIRADCSETVTLLCHLAGLKDPNGMNYDGYGNSHTMWQHLEHYADPAEALVGGIVVFGPSGYDHVAMVRRAGADPICFSHGGEPGPVFIRLSWLARALRPPRQMLSIAGLL